MRRLSLFAVVLFAVAFTADARAQQFRAPVPPGLLIAYDSPPAIAPAPAPAPAQYPNTPDAATPPNPGKQNPPYGVPPSKQTPPLGAPPVPPKSPPYGVPPTYPTPQTYGTPQTTAYGSPQYGSPPQPQCPPCPQSYGYAPPDDGTTVVTKTGLGGVDINTKRKVIFRRNTGLGNLGASGRVNVNTKRRVVFKNNSF